MNNYTPIYSRDVKCETSIANAGILYKIYKTLLMKLICWLNIICNKIEVSNNNMGQFAFLI